MALISAQDARKRLNELLDSTINDFLDDISGMIESAIGRRTDTIRFDLPKIDNPKLVGNLIDQLEKLGYTVKNEKGSDQRDGEAWDYLSIKF